jgi:TonB family protein
MFALDQRSSDRSAPLLASATLHSAAVVILLMFGDRVLTSPPRPAKAVLFAPAVARDTPPVPELPKPRSAPFLMPRRVAVAPRAPLLLDPPTIRAAEAPALVSVPVPQSERPSIAERPRPAAVVTGAFEPQRSVALPPLATVRAPVQGSFEVAVRPAAVDSTPRVLVPSTAGFTNAASDKPRPIERNAVASSAGFSEAPATSAPRSVPARSVAAAGFGTTGSPVAYAVQSPVKAAGFAEAAPAPATQNERPTPAPLRSTTIEITHKPRPAYTDEARRLQIEGEVLIEAVFSASGDVRVLRIVSGLGHGLDESAVLAARGIRFRPATRNGTPVDATATVRISFQLAY